ncbi:mycofactocin biosynthesis peptidyl-dipeptidase MftE [Cumulibacter soli]|uniref:mycofactocin biosynthesis peptidyl-dipeptidase MftE n=1 Tax=Cumulibacter soli TaxID=2546344 RepID=UPI0010687DB0|nr:mycofactocin biosynthesis peptidyl-dipeptidase MftE [Cumulibacter soli]
MELRNATSLQVRDLTAGSLVVPLGATEQHGPHLPLGTDTIVAEYVARRLVDNRAGLVLAPAIAIGASGEHAGFAGTLSIGSEALTAVLVEIVRDATRDYRRVILVNAHGGNAAAIAAAQRVCDYEKRPLTALYCAFPGADAHAGRTETSVMLAINPDLVDISVAEQGNTTPVRELLPAMRSGGVRAVSPNGILGDPTGATAEEGKDLLDGLLDRLNRELPH